jgi:hypothetical protein
MKYYTSPDYFDVLTQDNYDRLSKKAVSVIGQDRIDVLSIAQTNLLNASLDRIIKRRGSVEAVTDMELIGAYEMIVDNLFPAAFVAIENTLRSEE